jgi:ArsR family transcriptional regulator
VTNELRRFKADLFHGLAHPTRIAIVEALGEQELTAGKLIEKLNLEQANASQHLAVLRARQVVMSRKEGNQVYYSLRDPVLKKVLDLLKEYFYSHLTESSTLLKEMKKDAVKKDARKK